MTLHYPDDEALRRIGEGVLALNLAKAEWTHAAHFGCTLWLMRHRPDLDLPSRMPDIIRRYNVSVGGENTDTAGYHETITQASLRAARSVFEAHPESEPLHQVLDALMAGPFGDKNWLLAYWTPGRLFSVEARRSWVEPDIAPLPW